MNVPGIIFLLCVSILSGCGSNSRPDQDSVSTLETSQSCIDCHQATAVSSVTGELITYAWQLSAHNTASSYNQSGRGAGCGDCHEPESGHPNSCAVCHGGGSGQAGSVPVHNPDSALKCDKCHALTSTVLPLNRAHINPRSSSYTNYTASYLSSQFIGRCRSCHNPHNPSGHMKQNLEWAESGHGSYLANAWNSFDFKTRGTSAPATPANSVATACVRCHTTTGYINYVTDSDGRGRFTNISAWGRNGVVISNVNRTDPTKQVLACPACHDDGNGNSYSFAKRQVPLVTGYYNYSSLQTKKMVISVEYPDLSTSNICIACHSGRAIGATISAAGSGTVQTGVNASISPTWQTVNFAVNIVQFINSHYLTAGATVFARSGYDYSDPKTTSHSDIGYGTTGPCVGCHMSSSTSHSFLPVTKAGTARWSAITGITSTICGSADCHNGNWNAADLQAKKDGYLAALLVLKKALENRNFWHRESGQYAFTTTASGNTQVTNWGSEKNMGAAFNLHLLYSDPGGFAHNSRYVKRLIYDSIDWIDDYALNGTVGATISNYPDLTIRGRAATYLGL